MNENKNARPAVGAAEQASGTDYAGQYSQNHFNSKLTPCQEMVLGLIGTGRENAISRLDLIARSGLDERTLYGIIRILRVEHGFPVLSTKGVGGGYWLSNDSGEVRRAARSKDQEAHSCQEVANTFWRAADEMDGQETFDDWWEDDGVE